MLAQLRLHEESPPLHSNSETSWPSSLDLKHPPLIKDNSLSVTIGNGSGTPNSNQNSFAQSHLVVNTDSGRQMASYSQGHSTATQSALVVAYPGESSKASVESISSPGAPNRSVQLVEAITSNQQGSSCALQNDMVCEFRFFLVVICMYILK